MNRSYSDDFKGILALIVNNAPLTDLTREINKLKAEITGSIKEGQRILVLLDAIAEQYSARPSLVSTGKEVSIAPSSFVEDDQKERMFEVLARLEKDGVIETREAIPQLRQMGDFTKDTYVMVAAGNILHKHGWRKIGTGKYRKPDIQPEMGVK